MGSVPHPDSRVERHNALQLQENVFADMRLLQHDNEDEADDTKMEPLSTDNQNWRHTWHWTRYIQQQIGNLVYQPSKRPQLEPLH